MVLRGLPAGSDQFRLGELEDVLTYVKMVYPVLADWSIFSFAGS